MQTSNHSKLARSPPCLPNTRAAPLLARNKLTHVSKSMRCSQLKGKWLSKSSSTRVKTATLDDPKVLKAEAEKDKDAETSGALFQWTKQWYPVAVVDDTDPGRPHSIMLLGKKLVLWRDKDEKWCCFEDVCPHRKVPLSEGRIEESDGTLMCGYHGWRFAADGKPTYIPQISATDKKAEAFACSSPRAAAKVYPTQVKQELVWVWGECGPSALEDSRQKSPVINEFKESHRGEYIHQYHNYVRDLPGGFAVWLENSCDQSHVAFAHHGLAGQRGGEKEGYFITNTIESPAHEAFSFAFEFDFSTNGQRISTATMTYNPPCQIMFTIKQMPSTQLWINLVPVSPSCTRLIINNGGTNVPLPALLKAMRQWPLFKDLFRVLPHLELNAVNDGDAIFMHEQHENIQVAAGSSQAASKAWRPGYFLPAESDKGVSVWLKWLVNKGGGGPPFAANAPVESMWDGFGKLKREKLLDRYHQHTQHCAVCSKTLDQIRTGQKACIAALGALFLVTAAFLGQGVGALPLLGTTAIAGVCGWLLASLKKFERSFVFTDWRQPDLKPIKVKPAH